jgi:hypothetical protein
MEFPTRRRTNPDCAAHRRVEVSCMDIIRCGFPWVPLALVLAVPATLAGQSATDTSAAMRVRVTAGVGYTMVHLPAFTYTQGAARTPNVEPAQEGGGLAFGGAVEALRSRFLAGARFQHLWDPMVSGWSANVVAIYGGVARRRRTSVLNAAAGLTLVHRDQVTRQFAPGVCFFPGCEESNRVNNDGGSITTGGILLTVAAERRFADTFGVGLEGVAATGAQRYAGFTLRFSLSPP